MHDNRQWFFLMCKLAVARRVSFYSPCLIFKVDSLNKDRKWYQGISWYWFSQAGTTPQHKQTGIVPQSLCFLVNTFKRQHMPKDFLLILRTQQPGERQILCGLLQQVQIGFRELHCQSGRAEQSRNDFIENIYLAEADFSRLSVLKKAVESTMQYDALLLFEYISW